MENKVYIGADHGGFDLKVKIKGFLDSKGIKYEDINLNLDESDDYPDIASKVGKKVAKEKGSSGVLICGAGIGMCISANKIKGIRAAQVYDEFTARMSREHNDANVICLRGREIDYNKSINLLDIFLNTNFSKEERHKRRIIKIGKLEK